MFPRILIPPLPYKLHPTGIAEYDKHYDCRKSRRDESIVKNSIRLYHQKHEKMKEDRRATNLDSDTPENLHPTGIGEYDKHYDCRKSRRDESIVESSIRLYHQNHEKMKEDRRATNLDSDTPENHQPPGIAEYDKHYDCRKSRRDESIVKNSIRLYHQNHEKMKVDRRATNLDSDTPKTINLPELPNMTSTTIAENPEGMKVL